VDHREERIVVETERHRITGVLRLPRDGYRSRLSDYLNASELGFIPLTDAEIGPLDGSEAAQQRSFVAVSVGHIVLVSPVPGRQSDSQP
jgi:hypothetical protein